MPEAVRIAEEICELGPESVRVMKQLLHEGFDIDYEQLLHRMKSLIVPVVNSENTREGMNAFIERRKPRWKTR